MPREIKFENNKLKAIKIVISFTGLIIYISNIRGLPFELIDFLNIILFSLAFAAADFFAISMPQGGSYSAVSTIVIASLLLFKLPVALSVAFFGSIFSAIIKKRGILDFFSASGEHMLGMLVSASVFLSMGGKVGQIKLMESLVPIIGLALMLLLVNVLIEQTMLMARGPVAIARDSIGAIQIVGPFYTALVPIAALIAMMHKSLNFWGVILFFPAIYIVWYAHKLLVDIRKTYRDTLRALSSIIDVQEDRVTGNSRKVADLAVGMAKMLGVRGAALEDINNAALLRDIGKVRLEEDPYEHRYRAKAKKEEEADAHNEIGCEILCQVDSLRGSAEIIKHHHSPFRLADGSRISIGAQVLHLAGRYDDLVSGRLTESKLSSREAIAQIKKDQGTTFDPKLIRILINILRHGNFYWAHGFDEEAT